MFYSKYSKLLTIILIISILVIIGGLVFVVIDWYKTYTNETEKEELIQQFDNYINQIVSSEQTETNTENNNDNNSNNSVIGTNNKNMNYSINSELRYKGFKVIGKIEIPSIDIKYPILEELTPESIKASIVLLYGEGINQIGNTVLIGHNYRNKTFFSNIENLPIGDKIYITDMEGRKITYIIYKKYITDVNDFDYAIRETNGKREISLSTCTDDSQNRLIIWAKEV